MRLCMLGTGMIAEFYLSSLHGHRSRDQVVSVYSRTRESADKFATKWSIPNATDEIETAINRDDVDAVIVGLPNHQHEAAVIAAAKAGKAVMCTKPLGRNAEEAMRLSLIHI